MFSASRNTAAAHHTDVRRDLRFGIRSLLKTPAFTIAATLALALGIGATTAILSVVNGVLLRPLPYADSDRLVVLLHNGQNPVAPANFVDWRAQTRSFTDIAAAEYWTRESHGDRRAGAASPASVSRRGCCRCSAFVRSWGACSRAEEEVGWQRACCGAQLWIVATSLRRRSRCDRSHACSLDGDPFTIIGVMPQTFQFAPFWATHAELWAPLALGARATSRGGNSLRVFARLRPGVTLEQARADFAAVTARLEREYPGTNRNVTRRAAQADRRRRHRDAALRPARRRRVRAAHCLRERRAHAARARRRRAKSELAIRTALGATRGRLISQMLIESALLALGGGIAGLLLAVVGRTRTHRRESRRSFRASPTLRSTHACC